MGRKKILIIDDEKLILTTTALLLRHADMDVITANSGTEGIVLAEKEKPDIILLDIMMPGMDGWSVLSRLKADDRFSGTPVIVFSGDDTANSRRKARESGASAVFTKPFDSNELIETVGDLTGKERP
jgi:DNA-binding response OmpR family regulator